MYQPGKFILPAVVLAQIHSMPHLSPPRMPTSIGRLIGKAIVSTHTIEKTDDGPLPRLLFYPDPISPSTSYRTQEQSRSLCMIRCRNDSFLIRNTILHISIDLDT